MRGGVLQKRIIRYLEQNVLFLKHQPNNLYDPFNNNKLKNGHI